MNARASDSLSRCSQDRAQKTFDDTLDSFDTLIVFFGIGISLVGILLAGLSFWNSWKTKNSIEKNEDKLKEHQTAMDEILKTKIKLQNDLNSVKDEKYSLDQQINSLTEKTKWLEERVTAIVSIIDKKTQSTVNDPSKWFRENTFKQSPSVEEKIQNKTNIKTEYKMIAIHSDIVPDEIIKQVNQIKDQILFKQSMGYKLTSMDYTILATASYNIGDYDKALELNTIALSIDSTNKTSLINHGNILSRKGNFEESNIYLDKIIKVDQNAFYAHYNKGLNYYNEKEWYKALDSYESAIRIKEDYGDAWLNKGLTLRKLGRDNEELEAYEMAIKHNPRLEMAKSNIGWYYDQKGNFDEAKKYYNEALTIKRDSDIPFNNIIELYLKTDKKVDAETLLNKARKYDTKNIEFIKTVGFLLSKIGEHDQAKEYLESKLQTISNPEGSGMLELLGYVCIKGENFIKAQEYVDESIRVNPENGLGYFNSASILALIDTDEKENKKKILELLKIAIEKDPKYKKDAREDEDFKAYRNDPEFKKLTEE